MALATINGNLSDFTGAIMNPYQPQIVFTPSGPGVNGQSTYVTRPIKIQPFASGGFRVELQSNDIISPITWYEVSIEWLDAAGNYIYTDYFDWKLFVPPEGGDFGALLKTPSNPAAVWVGVTAPDNPTPGTWWLNPVTGDLYEWTEAMAWMSKANLRGARGPTGPVGPVVKAVRLESGKWIWDLAGATHYVIPDSTGALVVRATIQPEPSATPTITW